jgi:hypothetical protein
MTRVTKMISRSMGVRLLLSLMLTLMLVLSWTTVADAQSLSPFDTQYQEPGLPLPWGASHTSTVAGQGRSVIPGMLPSTGGSLPALLVLGSFAFCFGSALLVQQSARNRRR